MSIDRFSGTADPRALHIEEVIGPGTVFEGELRLSDSLSAEEAFAVQLSMRGIRSVGARRSASLGACTFEVFSETTNEEALYHLDSSLSPLTRSERRALSLWVPDVNAHLIARLAMYPEEARCLSPRRFEELIAELLRRDGFAVELTPVTHDGGYDILAVRHDQFAGKHTYLVECKRYADARPVRIDVVRSLLGVVHAEHATKGVLVTTSRFTSDAKQHAERFSTRIALRDFDVLKTWLNSIGLTSPDGPSVDDL